MKLPTKIRYGARAVLELASHYGSGPVDLQEIARKENISPKYLEQVITPLKAAGLVKSVRGAKGGYSLARPPSEISLEDVFDALEGPLSLVHCLSDPRSCERSPACVTREIWKQLSEAISGVLRSATLDRMLKRREEKRALSALTYEI